MHSCGGFPSFVAKSTTKFSVSAHLPYPARDEVFPRMRGNPADIKSVDLNQISAHARKFGDGR